ncbi:MAG: metal ABC transporter permease [Defluviitaleaceae bacterium]|nr:metal ABC transporter permease [Defluviitaleaceae bacterium]
MEQLTLYFSFPFVRYAMVVGVLIALCSSLLGVTLVLKRYSFIGTGLSNVAFGATAVAAALSFTNNFLLVLPVTVVSSIFLLRSGQDAKVKGDAALAMISVGSLAIGYLIMNVFSQSANLAGDVCTVLFGATSILTLTETELWLSIILSVSVVAVFLLLYHKIFAVTFDESFSTATGVNAKMYNLILTVVIAVVIVLAMSLVGALLISALVIFPAMSAMQVFKSFKCVTVCSVIFSMLCAASGILVSIIAGTPVGSTIVAVNIAGFAVFGLIGLLIARRRI